jgi:hypothetical protein
MTVAETERGIASGFEAEQRFVPVMDFQNALDIEGFHEWIDQKIDCPADYRSGLGRLKTIAGIGRRLIG